VAVCADQCAKRIKTFGPQSGLKSHDAIGGGGTWCYFEIVCVKVRSQKHFV
jgi:hypothetical protein